MKKVFAILLVLMLALILLPAPEAKAYTKDQTCPSCNTGFLALLDIVSNEKVHAFCCTNPDCEHFGMKWPIYEDHWGGTATCTERAKCAGCGWEYGEPLGHDPETEWMSDITIQTHYHVCKRCGARVDERRHSYLQTPLDDSQHQSICEVCGTEDIPLPHVVIDWTDNGDGTHIGNCALCGYEMTEGHYGREATCVAKAKCEAYGCNAEYGETNLNNHVWETASYTNEEHTLTCIRGCGTTITEPHQRGSMYDAAYALIWSVPWSRANSCTL